MKLKLLFLSLCGFVYSVANAQQLTTIFEDNFEAYDDFAISNIGEWTLRDVDDLPTYGFNGVTFPNMNQKFAFIVFNSNETTPSIAGHIWDANSGNKCMAAIASEGDSGVRNDDWLISPKVKLLNSENKVSFFAKSVTLQYGAERFKVWVSTTDTEVASFTLISEGDYVEATDSWEEYSYNLDQYQGKEVHIAINCVSSDAFGFAVDDFKVVGSTQTASINKALDTQFVVFPNPVDGVVNFNNSANILVSRIELIDINGRTVKSFDFDLVSASQFDISQLQAGVYFINISTNEGSFTKKIIKK